jgi:D-3-phosphoglycerate dehydrogenase / 2-oxoglutarate reductase
MSADLGKEVPPSPGTKAVAGPPVVQGILVPTGVGAEAIEAIRRRLPSARMLRLSFPSPSLALRIAEGARRRLALPGVATIPVLHVDGRPLAGHLPAVQILLATAEVTREAAKVLIPALPDLEWVHSTVTGVDRLAGLDLGRRGVVVSSPRGVHARRIAEFVLGIIYADAKNIVERCDDARRGQPAFMGSIENRDLTVGVLGFGAIGQEVARLAQANGLGVVAWARTPASAPRLEGVAVSTLLDDVLARSNVLVLALPLTDRTRHLIGAREVALLPKGSLLINVGRGANLVEEALFAALEGGHLRRAFLDVVERGPPRRHPLCRTGRIILTGHSASESRHASADLEKDFLVNLDHRCRGEPLPGWIDLERGY